MSRGPSNLPVLDGLRAIAVLLVLWNHMPPLVFGDPEWLKVAGYLIGPGGLGVEIFFVLSGFLITRILLAERAIGAPVRWFLVRRLLRIFPIYYLLLLVMLPFRPLSEIGWCAAYLYNLKSILWPWESGPLEHTWSLCIEEHFYLLWPLVVAFAPGPWARRTLVWFVMPAAAIGALLVGHWVADDPHAMKIVAHGSPFRFLTLGCGCLLAFWEPQLFAAPRRLLAIGLLSLGVGLALHPHLLFAFGPLWSGTEWVSRPWAPLVQLLHGGAWCTGIVLLALHAGTTRWSPLRALSWRPLRAIGRISYALYLYHLPIYATVVWPAPTTRNGLIAAGLSFAAAAVSYFVIERPCQRFGNRFRTATRAGA